MSKRYNLFIIAGLILALGACSSSQTSGDNPDEETIPAADAETDAIPQEDAEGGESVADNAAPTGEESSDQEMPPSDAPQEAALDAPPPAADSSEPGAEAPPADSAEAPPVANAEAAPAPDAAADLSSTPTAPATTAESTPPLSPPATDSASASVSAEPSAPATPAAEAPSEGMASAASADASGATEAHSEQQSSIGSSGAGTHTVQRGDTLMKIAFEVYGDLFKWKDLYEANKDKIQDPNQLPVGIELTYEKPAEEPSISRKGEEYVIKRGDTLGSIAEDVYGTSKKWRKIWKNNKTLIKDPNKIFAGFTLYYIMTPQDQEEYERFKSQEPAPLADASGTVPNASDPMANQQQLGDVGRMPASEPAPGTSLAENNAATPPMQEMSAVSPAAPEAQTPPEAPATQ